MKKSEIIDLLKDIADDGDINETLLGHNEFKGLKDLSKLSADDIDEIIKGEVGKAYMKSHDDTVRSKAVDTFKKGKMQDEIKKAVEEATNPTKTPEMKRIEELEKKNAELEAKTLRNATNDSIGKILKEKKLPSELIDLVYGDGKEETYKGNIDVIEKIINESVDNGVKAKLGTSSYTPPTDAQTNALNSQIAQAMGVK